MDLIGALQGLIDPLHYCRNAVRRIETLIGIHLAGEICVGRHLPAAQIDRLQSRFDLLHRLIAGQRAEGRNKIFGVQQFPKLFRAAPRQRVLDDEAALQTLAHRLTNSLVRSRSSADRSPVSLHVVSHFSYRAGLGIRRTLRRS